MSRSIRLFSVVIANLQRSRSHFVLASIGIVVGIATFTFFMALGSGVRQIVLGTIFPLDQLEVVQKSLDFNLGPLQLGVGSDVLDDAKVSELATIGGVASVYPKMRLTVPAIAIGGQAILGSDLRTELIADGLEPDLVANDIAPNYVFRDFDAELRSDTTAQACTNDRECGERRYCGLPVGTRLPADPEARNAKLQVTGKVCRDYIPVIASNHVVEIYNGAIRRAHRFPRLNPQAVLGFTFDMTIGASMVRNSNKSEVIREKGMLVGFSDKAITLGITLPIGYVKRYNAAFGSERNASQYHSAVVLVPKKNDVARVAKRVGELGLDIVDTGAEQAGLLIAIFVAVFGLVSVVIVAIAAINIMHVFFMLVYERQHEIGIMRAVGATRWDVTRIILGEAALLGLIAGALGVLLALGTARFCDAISSRYIPDFPYKPETYFAFPGWLPILAIGFAIAFCILGAWFPARRAARLEPARVLSGH